MAVHEAQGVREAVRAAILGHAVGDALGVPVEFLRREELERAPVDGMRGHGTHDQPAGTWSDDTSLSLCLADSLCSGFDLADQGRRFVQWMREARWTAHDQVFDIGNTTFQAISRLESGVDPVEAGPAGEGDNGNGSLMRILPLAVYLAHAPRAERVEATMNCSRLTHAHPRSCIACCMLVEIAAALVRGSALLDALDDAVGATARLVAGSHPDERLAFARLLSSDLGGCDRSEIGSTGYVIHSLESALWCCAGAESYRDAVLTAVNLGGDTDTNAAITGGIAALAFGVEAVPDSWLDELARREDIERLCGRLAEACMQVWSRE
ncbi:MAG: ADP-ribosylglycohydrolase family protein [Planctomycetes bacterium]|nr:ADP-ribosylglycohydrolase family protein [Planctomycetota bacterium]